MTQAPARPSQDELKQEYLDSPADFPLPVALLHIKSEGEGTSKGNPLCVFDSHEPCTFGRDPALANVVFSVPDLHKIGFSGKSFIYLGERRGWYPVTDCSQSVPSDRAGRRPPHGIGSRWIFLRPPKPTHCGLQIVSHLFCWLGPTPDCHLCGIIV